MYAYCILRDHMMNRLGSCLNIHSIGIALRETYTKSLRKKAFSYDTKNERLVLCRNGRLIVRPWSSKRCLMRVANA